MNQSINYHVFKGSGARLRFQIIGQSAINGRGVPALEHAHVMASCAPQADDDSYLFLRGDTETFHLDATLVAYRRATDIHHSLSDWSDNAPWPQVNTSQPRSP
jgi:hypothetical protein